jgi:hypothetical protein
VTLRSEPEAIEEMVRFEVEAVVAVMAVVDAYGMLSAEEAGAEKLMVIPLPTTAPVPVTEIAVPFDTDEVPTDCIAPVPAP